jgi:hypothetical protein
MDIRLFYKDILIGKIDGLSYTISREPTPIYVLPGYKAKKSDSINGSIIFSEIYKDKIPNIIPTETTFNLIVISENDDGQKCELKLKNIEFINEGSTMKVEELEKDKQITFIGKIDVGWKPIGV